MIYWAISEEAFVAALKRAYEGENPYVIYAEIYANSENVIDEP